ncbi:MAG TPA: methyltransferase domain-containing protein [Verrucomicrobiae bacterium]|jgi:SAM-dependent methyltransferase|nr:methyltransferase domain-containing protein [Verrucomicrobiae bacterium]
MNIDFGKTATDYAQYRTGFPDEFFERLFSARTARSDDRVLDIGTGTGTLARGFAVRGCDVVGLDPAASLLAEARRLDATNGVTSVRYVVGRAEQLPFEDAAFDIVSAGQCWHWFEGSQAATEALRVLKPGGRLVIAHFDWIPLPGNVVEATEVLIAQHNPQWKLGGGTGLHPSCLADAAIAGFTGIETLSFDVAVPYSREAWRGRIRASAGIAASLADADVARFDSHLAQMLRENYPQDPLTVPHRVWAMTARASSS